MKSPFYNLARKYAGVCVKHTKSGYILTDEMGETLTAVTPDTMLVELSEELVYGQNMEILKPSGRFFRTAQTIDPYHIILDILDISALNYIGYC